eukprot:s54_g17.t1
MKKMKKMNMMAMMSTMTTTVIMMTLVVLVVLVVVVVVAVVVVGAAVVMVELTSSHGSNLEEAHSDGKATVCRSKANLFSLLHDTLPTGPVTLDMIVVRRDRPSTPTLKRTPRPAPDFRQTEDWQRAKEAQLRRCPWAVTIMKILLEQFAEQVTETKTGHKLLPPYIRVIQGNGVDSQSIPKILNRFKDLPANIFFANGGAVWQKVSRDTFKIAFKRPEIVLESGEDPLTDDAKVDVFLNGRLLKEYKLSEIRKRADVKNGPFVNSPEDCKPGASATGACCALRCRCVRLASPNYGARKLAQVMLGSSERAASGSVQQQHLSKLEGLRNSGMP